MRPSVADCVNLDQTRPPARFVSSRVVRPVRAFADHPKAGGDIAGGIVAALIILAAAAAIAMALGYGP